MNLILDDYISRIDDLFIYASGTHIQFDHKKGKIEYANLLYEELKDIPHTQTWKKSEIPARFHFNNDNTGDYLLLADEGWLITTKSAIDENEFTLKGMHGYDPQLSNMHGIFYTIGPDLKSGLQIPAFENIFSILSIPLFVSKIFLSFSSISKSSFFKFLINLSIAIY